MLIEELKKTRVVPELYPEFVEGDAMSEYEMKEKEKRINLTVYKAFKIVKAKIDYKTIKKDINKMLFERYISCQDLKNYTEITTYDLSSAQDELKHQIGEDNTPSQSDDKNAPEKQKAFNCFYNGNKNILTDVRKVIIDSTGLEWFLDQNKFCLMVEKHNGEAQEVKLVGKNGEIFDKENVIFGFHIVGNLLFVARFISNSELTENSQKIALLKFDLKYSDGTNMMEGLVEATFNS